MKVFVDKSFLRGILKKEIQKHITDLLSDVLNAMGVDEFEMVYSDGYVNLQWQSETQPSSKSSIVEDSEVLDKKLKSIQKSFQDRLDKLGKTSRTSSYRVVGVSFLPDSKSLSMRVEVL